MVDPESTSLSPDKLEDVLSRLTKQQLYLGESVNAMTLKIDELIQRISPVFSTTPPTPPPLPPPVPTPIHRLKLDVPRFDGSDPLGWIYKITQFFEYHGTPDSDKLTIASFYMEGRALAWFQWMNTSEQFPSWPAFLHALRTRFASSQFEDPSGALSKLTQTGTVTQYLSDFEDLANRTTGLPSTFHLPPQLLYLRPHPGDTAGGSSPPAGHLGSSCGPRALAGGEVLRDASTPSSSSFPFAPIPEITLSVSLLSPSQPYCSRILSTPFPYPQDTLTATFFDLTTSLTTPAPATTAPNLETVVPGGDCLSKGTWPLFQL